MLRDTIYSINLGLQEGRCSLEIRLTKETGHVELTLFMDNDGDKDILIAGHTSNNVVWLENPLNNQER